MKDFENNPCNFMGHRVKIWEMKQKLDEIRTLAIKLQKASEAQKMEQPRAIWGQAKAREWRDLPSESVAVWDAVAKCAYKALKGNWK